MGHAQIAVFLSENEGKAWFKPEVQPIEGYEPRVAVHITPSLTLHVGSLEEADRLRSLAQAAYHRMVELLADASDEMPVHGVLVGDVVHLAGKTHCVGRVLIEGGRYKLYESDSPNPFLTAPANYLVRVIQRAEQLSVAQ